jgi:hypothetical protein
MLIVDEQGKRKAGLRGLSQNRGGLSETSLVIDEWLDKRWKLLSRLLGVVLYCEPSDLASLISLAYLCISIRALA